MEGGYHRANVELKAYLRDGWVLPALPVLVEESAAALGEAASEAAREERELARIAAEAQEIKAAKEADKARKERIVTQARNAMRKQPKNRGLY